MTEVLSKSEINRKGVIMQIAVSGYSIRLGAMGLATALVLLAACGPAATPTPTAPMPEPGAEWHYVVFGDSTAWGFPKFYAAYIQEDLGVKVTVHNKTSPGQQAHVLLRRVRNDQELRELVSEAEVVTFIANPLGSKSGAHPGDWTCIGDRFSVVDCSPETFDVYKEHLEAIIGEILFLRRGSPTIIRAMDYYMPIYSEWKEQGIHEECTYCWENMNEAIHQAASEHNVPLAHVYDAFNGPNHDEDPREKGYIGPDGEHTSEEGQKVIADLFRELGYEPLGP